ncbi:MAG: hypothetical protein WBB85_09040, partial [Albidovulum sp.]|uniref:hypothetical protein n=1 Tax=Albidovulum sp. TaxID=1872424 RepID=UPI003CB37E41
RGSVGARSLSVARMAIGAGLAFFLFPILFWLFYQGDSVPARAFGYIGFWTAAIFIAALTLASGALERLGPTLLRAGLVTLALVSFILSISVSAFWYDSARVGKRDEELARAIYTRLAATPGYDGGSFRLVGSANISGLSWGTLAGWSSIHAGNPTIGLFREMYGMADYTVSLPVSPRACNGFPADGATFIHNGTTYLCLEDFPPYPEAMRCADIADAPGERICLLPKAYIHIGPSCLPTGTTDPELSVAFQRKGRAYAPVRSFSVASFTVPMPDGCHTIALAPSHQDLEAMTLTMTAPDGATLWEGRITPADLSPYAL